MLERSLLHSYSELRYTSFKSSHYDSHGPPIAIFRPEPDPEEIGCAPVKELAMCLTVTVHHRKRTDWGEVDLQANNVLIHEEGVTSCAFVQDIIEQLRQPRYYSKVRIALIALGNVI